MYTLTPLLVTADTQAAMDWYRDALGARLIDTPQVATPGHSAPAQLNIHGALMRLGEVSRHAEFPSSASSAPAVTLHLVVEDVDAVAETVRQTGIRLEHGPEDHELAGRVAVFQDPFGHRWFLSTPGNQAEAAPVSGQAAQHTPMPELPQPAREPAAARAWHLLRDAATAALRDGPEARLDRVGQYQQTRAEALRYLAIRNINR